MLTKSFWALLRNSVVNVRLTQICSMYNHPYTEFFKKKRDSVSPDYHKQITGLTGLFVDEKPHFSLRLAYGRLLGVLSKMPEDYVYRVNTEQIVRQRLAIVDSEKDIQKVEEKIGMGQAEELCVQADYELQAANELLTNRAWEPLVDKPSEAQWRWPIH